MTREFLPACQEKNLNSVYGELFCIRLNLIFTSCKVVLLAKWWLLLVIELLSEEAAHIWLFSGCIFDTMAEIECAHRDCLLGTLWFDGSFAISLDQRVGHPAM